MWCSINENQSHKNIEGWVVLVEVIDDIHRQIYGTLYPELRDSSAEEEELRVAFWN